MTNYITIQGVKKRGFVIQARMPELSTSAITKINADDTRITRSGDTRITRDGDIRVTHNITSIYPRSISGVIKRSFTLHAKVNHG